MKGFLALLGIFVMICPFLHSVYLRKTKPEMKEQSSDNLGFFYLLFGFVGVALIMAITN